MTTLPKSESHAAASAEPKVHRYLDGWHERAAGMEPSDRAEFPSDEMIAQRCRCNRRTATKWRRSWLMRRLFG